jgi:hypothetical protein
MYAGCVIGVLVLIERRCRYSDRQSLLWISLLPLLFIIPRPLVGGLEVCSAFVLLAASVKAQH